jgi:hypothetical protein
LFCEREKGREFLVVGGNIFCVTIYGENPLAYEGSCDATRKLDNDESRFIKSLFTSSLSI